MATPRKKKPAFDDPAESVNRRILQQRQERIIQGEVENTLDLGLNLQHAEATSAAELLRDEWDKKAFGDAPKIATRIVYGPDPLVDNCPGFHERLEKHGLETIANAFYELIMKKGELAAPDAIMRKGLRLAIHKFGTAAAAEAFRDRVLQIPCREVEVEIDDELDPLLVNPMRAIVAKYCPPGMAPKFLSPRCIDVLGKRGYEIVKDERGDPVKCGTLILGLIPAYTAERRRQHYAQESRDMVREQEENFYETAARIARDEGGGGSPLRRGESVTVEATEHDATLLGQQRGVGLDIGGA